jgi:hypothetical protein
MSPRFHFSLPFNVNILMVVMSVLVPLSATLLAVGWSAVDALETANTRLRVAMAAENVARYLVERMGAKELRTVGQRLAAVPFAVRAACHAGVAGVLHRSWQRHRPVWA